MSRFIQLHLLTAYPPANLNRDDMGSPKTAKMGGYDRLRVSSQCLKRTWRTSAAFAEALDGHIGTRTKEMGLKAYQQMIDKGISHKKALEWSKPIAGTYGKLKQLTKKDKDGLKKLSDDERVNKELEELEIEQLAFFDTQEELAILNLAKTVAEREEEANTDELNFLRQKVTNVDIALFGRMLTKSDAGNSLTKYCMEAACQVAHAISVHPIIIEDDYFTAIDDLNDGHNDAGASHIGETRFAAGLFYSYICINRELLIENLNGDEALANKAIRALTEAAVKVAPEGKQNSFASRAYASYVLAEKGNQQPRSLSVAYLKPIMDRENKDFIADSITALVTQRDSFDKVYGACSDSHYQMDVSKVEGSLVKLLDFVGQ
ncbi:MAG: type I-E CRISPR-associated protein Cas7/Cse4/CasC [Methylococcaceae bacterium]|nr:type I-E CRISPR-associated protein Cas7/Cse4/CasC [Methylococcaceae bacterium]